jgi:MFS family permease
MFPGIHIFMALYGLSVFLETPKPQRKGRKRYIAASFIITVLSSLAGSLDMANFFQSLFRATSPSHWRELVEAEFYSSWKYLLGYTSAGLYVAIGDALLVSVLLDFFPTTVQCSHIFRNRYIAVILFVWSIGG